MSTLAFTNSEIAAEAHPAEPAKSLWTKIYDRVVAAQQVRAERAVAAYLASHGGMITDDMEREIMARMSANGSFRRPN